ncbi:hypothetical protein LAZ67_X000614 [Cordylochernes scorpioides]|uniref:Transposase n=1 Tax=Cordylochernes scorpioides TaxID=51811 RepID=A0ABY6LVT7_9ARAC|nr:hypothetical protein LAZ67_X000614 [Cordylochernes scorpioides]
MPGHRKRRQFKQTDAFTRGMVIGLKRAGWSIRQIAADTHLGASTVHRMWRRWLEQGNVAIYRNVGATRVTSARVDRRILRQAVAAPQATCTAILQHVQDTLYHSISNRTISRRLVANGLHSCRPLRRLPLTPPNRRQRLEWCRARSTWMTEWHRVVFSDESRFCLSSDSRRVRVWRRRGERSNPAAIVERPTVRQRGIMVWGAIAYDSRSPLLRIQSTMTAQRYVDDVLRPDNARPHTARISQQALQDVQMLPWPPYSPDLSPIEHVWDIIGRRLHALPQPCSEDELWRMVEREWRAIPQDAIRTLIDSLPRRVAACIAGKVKNFSSVIRADLEDPQELGQQPLSVLRQWSEEYETSRKPGAGRPRVIPQREDRRIRSMPVADSTTTVPIIQADLHVKNESVLSWCEERRSWAREWHSVIFSDESRFSFEVHYVGPKKDSIRTIMWKGIQQEPPGFMVLSGCANPSAETLPPDVEARCRDILEDCGGRRAGAYSYSEGVGVIRRHVAEFISKRDGYEADPQNVILVPGASDGLRVSLVNHWPGWGEHAPA